MISGGKVALVRRPAKGLLGGMLGLPTSAWRETPWREADALAAAPSPGAWRHLGDVAHAFTHFSLTLSVYEAHDPRAPDGAIWTPREEALAGTPTLFRKALEISPPSLL
jgi:A/G-specific adenine glycosylase